MGFTTRPFFHYAARESDGERNANVDGSVTPQVFKLRPPAGSGYRVHRINISIGDTGSLDAGGYGAEVSPLTNGVEVGVYNYSDDSLIYSLSNNTPIRYNVGWGLLCYDLTAHDWGLGANFLLARWDLFYAGAPVGLSRDEYLGFVINDDCTFLEGHLFLCQGVEVPV